MISLSPAALALLKTEAAPKASDVTDGRPVWVSTNNALVAFLWKHIMKARFPLASSPGSEDRRMSVVTVALEARKHVSPPIPPSYVGNVIFCCMTKLPPNVLTSPNTTMGSLAMMIRRNLEACKDPRMLADAIALASCVPDVRSLTYSISNWTREELVTTSWVDLPFFELEWGSIFGDTRRAEFFRFPKGQLDGLCFMHPRRLDGTIEINIGLEVEQMKRLVENEEFTKYATLALR